MIPWFQKVRQKDLGQHFDLIDSKIYVLVHKITNSIDINENN